MSAFLRKRYRNGESCENCKWWMTGIRYGEGQCHRFPPFVAASSRITGLYLVTQADTSCGEFARDTTKAPTNA